MRATLIVPCYNEANRLAPTAFAGLLEDDHVDLLFVDDGSKDTTRLVLDEMARAKPKQIRVLALEQNSGKAEAVRRGLLSVIDAERATYVGYFDADLATPASEIKRLIGVMRDRDPDVLFGARVALLGHAIDRKAARHYLGRVFATLASLALRTTTYDTQCGAKLFRVTPALAEAVSERFISRWAFDVELLGRMLIGSPAAPPISGDAVWEEPLRAWRDVKGSKLDPKQMGKALLDLLRIERDLARRRRARVASPVAAASAKRDVERVRAPG